MTVDRDVDLERFRDHVERQVELGPSAIFVCCGTGEFYSLTCDEHRDLVRTAVEVVGGRAPVIAGVGHGVAMGRQLARTAAEAGADGVLALPPSVLRGPQDGLVAYVESIVDAVDLPVIAYQRDTAVFHPASVAELINRVGVLALKDGHGDLDLLLRARVAVGERFRLLNGMPTAELTAAAYRAIGATSYSSAVQCFVPEISLRFRAAVSEGDAATMASLLEAFFGPFANLRDLVPGYAVSLIKAGLRIRGFDPGPVRPPLVNVRQEHERELEVIVEKGLAAAA